MLYSRDFILSYPDGESTNANLDTLRKLVDHFEKLHFALLKGTDDKGDPYDKSETVDSQRARDNDINVYLQYAPEASALSSATRAPESDHHQPAG